MSALMPLITVYTSAQAPAADRAQALLRDLSTTVGSLLGKPEKYMMAYLVPNTSMVFGGSPEPACYVEVRSIGGLTKESVLRLTQAVCKLVEQGIGVPPSRTYLACDDVPGQLWGWDGRTFG